MSGGWLDALTGDAEIAARLGEPAQLADMIRIEAAYARACGAVGKTPAETGEAAAQAIERVILDRAALAARAGVDGLPVPGLVAQIKAQVEPGLQAAVHQGLTSQDVMDSALALALRDCVGIFESRLKGVKAALAGLEARFGQDRLMARTRMQAALPVTVGHRIAGWAAPLDGLCVRLDQMRPRVLRLQLGGPVGTGDSFDGYHAAIADHMAKALGLEWTGRSWHSDRSGLIELGGWCATLAGALGKIGQDIALMAQQGVDEISLSGGGASSAMAHKSNPIRAEVLVALARELAALQGGLHQGMVHEQERSGAAWTLEWLILPRLLEGCGAGLRVAVELLGQVQRMGPRDPS